MFSWWTSSSRFIIWYSLLINLIPIVIVSALFIFLGLLLIPNGMIKGFEIFGQIIVVVATLGLAFGAAPTLNRK